MSRNQWIILAVLGLAVAMVFGCISAFALLHLTGSFPTETTAPVQPVDTPTEQLTDSPTPQPSLALCKSQTTDYLGEIEPLSDEFLDTVEVANSTSRIALSPVVQDMQAIRRDIADVPVPDCAQDASGLLMIGLGDVIDSFLDFMADSNSDAAIAQKMDMGLLEMMTATDQLISLAKGMELDGDDAGYAVCAEPILGEARQLVEEVYTASFQALDEASFVTFCREVPGWPPQLDSLRGSYEACPTPLDPHLQAAHLWLGPAYEDGANAMRSWANWCVENAQDLPFPNLDMRYTSIVHQMDRWEIAVQRAEEEIGRF